MRAGRWTFKGRPVRLVPDGDYDRIHDAVTGRRLGMVKLYGFRTREWQALRLRVSWPVQQWQRV